MVILAVALTLLAIETQLGEAAILVSSTTVHPKATTAAQTATKTKGTITTIGTNRDVTTRSETTGDGSTLTETTGDGSTQTETTGDGSTQVGTTRASTTADIKMATSTVPTGSKKSNLRRREETKTAVSASDEKVNGPVSVIKTVNALGKRGLGLEQLNPQDMLPVVKLLIPQLLGLLCGGHAGTPGPQVAATDELRRHFVYNNQNYFLFKSSDVSDSFKAQAFCESKDMHLIEINNEEEFSEVQREIGENVGSDLPVLIGGRRPFGDKLWYWQYSGLLVNYFSWSEGEPVSASINSDCIAMMFTAGLAEMVSISCYAEERPMYFLCQKELK